MEVGGPNVSCPGACVQCQLTEGPDLVLKHYKFRGIMRAYAVWGDKHLTNLSTCVVSMYARYF